MFLAQTLSFLFALTVRGIFGLFSDCGGGLIEFSFKLLDFVPEQRDLSFHGLTLASLATVGGK